MVLKNFLFLSLMAILLSGCSYTLVSNQKLETLNMRLTDLEENLSRTLSQELDTKLNQQNRKLQLLLEKSFTDQNQTLKARNKELISLIKSENIKRVPEEKSSLKIDQLATRDMDKLVVGSVEKVHIYPSNLIMNARIDTGAETSSINADDIVEFERDGKKWVRFKLFDEKTNRPYTLERKVVRRVRILQSSLEEGYEKRVVVKLKITIGNKEELSEFTLTSREHMQYPILVGRNVLQDLIIVDVSEEYMAPLLLNQEEKFQK